MEGKEGHEHLSRLRKRAIDQFAIGLVILLWGSLLMMKQAGIIDKTVSTLPFLLTAFGILLVIGGIYKLSTARRSQEKATGR
jgi:hypothetical protein